MLFADLVGKPGLPGAAGEGIAQPPYHLGKKDGCKKRQRPLQQEAQPDDKKADNDRQAAAVDICHHAGRHFAEQHREF